MTWRHRFIDMSYCVCTSFFAGLNEYKDKYNDKDKDKYRYKYNRTSTTVQQGECRTEIRR